jgi:nicotinate-nucleotide adenylyltransferase
MNAAYVLATRDVDRIWLMPVFRHPFGKSLAPFEDRVRMCEAMAGLFAGRVEVTTVEQLVPGNGRTIDTLKLLIERYPEHQFLLIVGTDILPERSKWKDFELIEKLVEVVVVRRAGYPSAQGTGPELPEVSSTEIRQRIAQGEDVSALVPREVLRTISERGLYRAPASP